MRQVRTDRARDIQDPIPGLKKQLEDEYRDVPEAQVEQVVKHALHEFEDARVRDFVPIFAFRHAREHLRQAS